MALAASTMRSRVTFIQAFDYPHGLATAPDWQLLTGTPADLEQVCGTYEISPGMMAGMMVHSEIVFVIDATGQVHWQVKDVPGPATRSAQSSFAALLANAARQALSLSSD